MGCVPRPPLNRYNEPPLGGSHSVGLRVSLGPASSVIPVPLAVLIGVRRICPAPALLAKASSAPSPLPSLSSVAVE